MAFIFVPYRGIYFLYHIAKFRYEYGAGFSSPIGESAFSTRNNKIQEKEENDFRPLSGNLLSLQNLSFEQVVERNFRPLSGNLLSLLR